MRKPIVEIENFDPEKYEELSSWDPNFWEKVTHVRGEHHREGVEFVSHFTYYAKKNSQILSECRISPQKEGFYISREKAEETTLQIV